MSPLAWLRRAALLRLRTAGLWVVMLLLIIGGAALRRRWNGMVPVTKRRISAAEIGFGCVAAMMANP